jgi:DNA-binding transcriptional LysR family regulator
MDISPFDLNLRHLRAIAAIAARGSMSAAADSVSLSQPALTQGIAKVERQLGIPLFERRPDGMGVTEEGRIVAGRVTSALEHLATAARSAGRGGARGFAGAERLMTATQLRAFISLADAGSFVGAAAATGLSQPALHRAVRDLEQVSGVPLVERRGRGVALTNGGRRLARGIRLAASEIRAAIAETRPHGETAGRIVVGAMPLCRAVLLPATLTRALRTMPLATVEVVEGSWRELVEPLRDGAIDFMIGALRDPAPADIEQRPLFNDRLAIVGCAGHPLAGHAAPTLDDLASFPWVVAHRDTPLRAQWEALFEGRALPPAPIVCGSAMTIRGVLAGSHLLTLLSPDQVALEVERGLLALIGTPLEDGMRMIGVTTRAGWRPTSAQVQFLDLVRDAAEAMAIPEIG